MPIIGREDYLEKEAARRASELYRVPPITGASAELNYIDGQERTWPGNGANHDIAWHRRYRFAQPAALEQGGGIIRRVAATRSVRGMNSSGLVKRDLADMGLTRLDAASEMQKPFWEA